jgi:hypothetical protein
MNNLISSRYWSRVLLGCSSLLVPRPERNEWLAEWMGELIYILQRREDGASSHRAITFCCGSFQDAFLLRWEDSVPVVTRALASGSWTKCFVTLIGLFFVSYVGAQFHLGFERAPHPDFYNVWIDDSMANVALQIAIAVLSLPAITSMELGEYPANSFHLVSFGVWRFWGFLCVKIVGVMVVSHYIGLCMTHCAESFAILYNYSGIYCAIRDALLPVQFLSTFASCLCGLGWAMRDQRRRCPTCLHLLSDAAIKGDRACIFLSWSGSERACLSGHGMLLTPDVRTSWQPAGSWQRFDCFWSRFSG